MTTNSIEPAIPRWTIKDVARFARMSESGVRRAYERGDLPRPHRVGKLLRWNPDEVVAAFATDKSAG
ncbi:MAG: hypothetical protein R3C10_27715 [Pirellulales bacterium]